eukprot:SAG25_NODE_93_length_16012_cov_22.660341_3_plen_182_part_00
MMENGVSCMCGGGGCRAPSLARGQRLPRAAGGLGLACLRVGGAVQQRGTPRAAGLGLDSHAVSARLFACLPGLAELCRGHARTPVLVTQMLRVEAACPAGHGDRWEASSAARRRAASRTADAWAVSAASCEYKWLSHPLLCRMPGMVMGREGGAAPRRGGGGGGEGCQRPSGRLGSMAAVS